MLYVSGQLLLKPDQFCGFILPNTCGSAYDPMHDPWNVTFPNISKPEISPAIMPPVWIELLKFQQKFKKF